MKSFKLLKLDGTRKSFRLVATEDTNFIKKSFFVIDAAYYALIDNNNIFHIDQLNKREFERAQKHWQKENPNVKFTEITKDKYNELTELFKENKDEEIPISDVGISVPVKEEPKQPAEEEAPAEDIEEVPEEEIIEEEVDLSDIKSAITEAAKKQLLLKVTYRDRDGNVTEGRYIEPWEIRDQYLFAGDNYGDPSISGETGTKQFIMATFSDWELSEEPYQNPAGYPIKIK